MKNNDLKINLYKDYIEIDNNIDNNQMETYEFKLLQDNDFSIFKPFVVGYLDNKAVSLKYDFDNTEMPLSSYINANKLNVNDIKNIVNSIGTAINTVNDLLISDNSILLNANSILIDKDTKDISFIVVPNYKGDFNFQLSSLFANLIKNVDLNDKNAMTLSYELLLKSTQDEFNFEDLKDLVDRYDKSLEEDMLEVNDIKNDVYNFEETGMSEKEIHNLTIDEMDRLGIND